MALPTKPDMSHVWASGGAKVAPSNTKIDTGWTSEVPPFQWENWSQNRQDAFLDHINKSGFPVWDGLTNYEAAGQSLTKGSDGVIYKSVAASGPSTTVQDPVTDVSDTYWTVAFASVGAFLTQATADTRYTQRANNLSDVTNAATARTNLGVANAVEGGIIGNCINLRASATGTNAAVSVTVDSITLKNASNQQKVVNTVAVNPSFAVAGVNGLDVGAANSQIASTWYYVYVIWNGTTVAGLLSASATAPTLPPGYTHYARVGSVRTDATANKYPFSFIQIGRSIHWKPVAGSNLTAPFSIATGANTFPTVLGVSSYVPPTAGKIIVSALTLGAGGQAYVSTNNQYTTLNSQLLNTTAGTGGGSAQSRGELILESTNLWYGIAGSAVIFAFGYEDTF